MNPLIQLKNVAPVFLVALVCFGLLPTMQAVVPAPDGGYAGGNTAEGQSALFSLTTGGFNTAVGLFSLRTDTTGQLNTAIGAGTLLFNIADNNTATGAGALLNNTIGTQNTANGAFALFSNPTGSYNSAFGWEALTLNTTGGFNTAIGLQALRNNTAGALNTAIGVQALIGNTTGSENTAIGQSAGSNQTTGSNNVYIGSGILGVAGESNACYIASIFGQTSASGVPVLINSNNQLGTLTSSKRFKEDIKAMNEASEALFALKPVIFRYKKQIDPAGTSQFGLVAEEVEKVNPDLIVRDNEGKPYTVRYEAVNAMLLNEFLKEHCKVEQQEATITRQRKDFEAAIARQQKEIEALTATVKEQAAQIQKVSAQLELSKPAPQTVLNSR